VLWEKNRRLPQKRMITGQGNMSAREKKNKVRGGSHAERGETKGSEGNAATAGSVKGRKGVWRDQLIGREDQPTY